MNTNTDRKPRLTPQESAQALRKSLKDEFPDIRFSVKMSRGTAWGNYNVSWTGGPPSRDVESKVGKFAGESFDGMTDSTVYLRNVIDWKGEQWESGIGLLLFHRDRTEEEKTAPETDRGMSLAVTDHVRRKGQGGAPRLVAFDEGQGVAIIDDGDSGGLYTIRPEGAGCGNIYFYGAGFEFFSRGGSSEFETIRAADPGNEERGSAIVRALAKAEREQVEGVHGEEKETPEEWLARMFEYENCEECGRGVEGHDVCGGLPGGYFARCKPERCSAVCSGTHERAGEVCGLEFSDLSGNVRGCAVHGIREPKNETEPDPETVTVEFYRHRTLPGDPVAVFPEIEGSPGLVTCYEHVGQHGSADLELMRSSTYVRVYDDSDDVRALADELLGSVGYVFDRPTPPEPNPAEVLGELVITELGLLRNRAGRIDLVSGDKTSLGLGLTVRRWVQESDPSILTAIRAVLPDLEHYVSTHGPGPDVRLAALKKALGD